MAAYFRAVWTMFREDPHASMSEPQSIPNPLCEIGRTHPRDKHRMRPLEGFPGVWYCPKHELYATVLPEEVANSIERGAAYAMHDGSTGVAGRTGDERPGGIVFYYRPQR
jgi:hypothetical protein